MVNEYTCPMLTPGDSLPCRHYIRPIQPEDPGFCDQPTWFRCIEAMKHKLPSISYSRMGDFIQCRRGYYHAVIQGLEVKPQHLPEAIKMGRAWDAFLRNVHEECYDHLNDIEPLQLTPAQSAKIGALTDAYRDLEIKKMDGLLGCQYKIHVPVGTTTIVGIVDRAYEDLIVETKCSFNPAFYTQKENLTYQLGTYFLGNEQWESAVVEITRVPGHRTGEGRYADEAPDDFQKRIYSDIVSRPAHYFIGWDRKSRTFGVRFWRTEFDLDEVFSTYVHVLREIEETVKQGSWYRNNLACHVPAPCPFLPIKRTGVVSSEIYLRRNRPGMGE